MPKKRFIILGSLYTFK